MSESSLTGIKLAAIVAAAAMLSHDAGAFSLPGGVTLLFVLFAFDSPGKSMLQSFAFACAGAFAAAVALLPLYPRFRGALDLGIPLIDVVWFAAVLVLFLVDRARAGNTAAAPRSTAIYAPPEPVVPAPAPVKPILVRDEPVAPVVATPSEPPPGAIALKGGKQVSIYVNLMGEGMNMLRSVKAESLGRDYYHIIDVMPDNERWEFKPGQIVRCQKKTLSSGKALVAVEEAPRAQ